MHLVVLRGKSRSEMAAMCDSACCLPGVLPEQADVAVLDEIDSGLDIDALRDVADAVNGLKRPQSATIMVTHYKVIRNSPKGGWERRG